MKIFIVLACVTYSVVVYGQDTTKILFLNNLTFSEIKTKAKQENKNIFIDVTASWCGPCKMMEKDIFTQSKVAEYYNEKFLSISIQTDKTSHDEDEIKKWYEDATKIKEIYDVRQFPTFLFLNPDGKLIHRSFGYQNKETFLLTAQKGNKKKWDLGEAIQQYQEGKLSPEQIRDLALEAKKTKEDSLSNIAATDYKNNYLEKQSEEILLLRDNILFITQFNNLLNTKDKYFKLFISNPFKMDKIIGKNGYSESITDYVITREHIIPYLYTSEGKPKDFSPDWKRLQKTLSKKYTKNKIVSILAATKEKWYKLNEDWEQSIKYGIENIKLKKLDKDTTPIGNIILNNYIYYYILTYSENKEYLQQGIEWMEYLLKLNPTKSSWLDTYANLLYKTGKTAKAVEIQTKAIEQAKLSSQKYKEAEIKELTETLGKMKKGIKTWKQ